MRAAAGVWRWRRNPLRRATDLFEAWVALVAAAAPRHRGSGRRLAQRQPDRRVAAAGGADPAPAASSGHRDGGETGRRRPPARVRSRVLGRTREARGRSSRSGRRRTAVGTPARSSTVLRTVAGRRHVPDLDRPRRPARQRPMDAATARVHAVLAGIGAAAARAPGWSKAPDGWSSGGSSDADTHAWTGRGPRRDPTGAGRARAADLVTISPAPRALRWRGHGRCDPTRRAEGASRSEARRQQRVTRWGHEQHHGTGHGPGDAHRHIAVAAPHRRVRVPRRGPGGRGRRRRPHRRPRHLPGEPGASQRAVTLRGPEGSRRLGADRARRRGAADRARLRRRPGPACGGPGLGRARAAGRGRHPRADGSADRAPARRPASRCAARARPTVRRCTVDNPAGVGIGVLDGAGGVFEECEVVAAGQSGVSVRGGAHPRLERCRIHHASGAGLTRHRRGQRRWRRSAARCTRSRAPACRSPPRASGPSHRLPGAPHLGRRRHPRHRRGAHALRLRHPRHPGERGRPALPFGADADPLHGAPLRPQRPVGVGPGHPGGRQPVRDPRQYGRLSGGVGQRRRDRRARLLPGARRAGRAVRPGPRLARRRRRQRSLPGAQHGGVGERRGDRAARRLPDPGGGHRRLVPRPRQRRHARQLHHRRARRPE